MTEETKANRNFLDEMEGIVVFENSERELSEAHKNDLMALDELHSRLCEEFEKKEEQLLTVNSQIEVLVQENKELKETLSFYKNEWEKSGGYGYKPTQILLEDEGRRSDEILKKHKEE